MPHPPAAGAQQRRSIRAAASTDEHRDSHAAAAGLPAQQQQRRFLQDRIARDGSVLTSSEHFASAPPPSSSTGGGGGGGAPSSRLVDAMVPDVPPLSNSEVDQLAEFIQTARGVLVVTGAGGPAAGGACAAPAAAGLARLCCDRSRAPAQAGDSSPSPMPLQQAAAQRAACLTIEAPPAHTPQDSSRCRSEHTAQYGGRSGHAARGLGSQVAGF